jgi:hypothetical protein
MKKIVSLIIVAAFIFSGISVVASPSQTMRQSSKAISSDDNVPVWTVDNSWTYTINNIVVNYSYGGKQIHMNGQIDDFTWTVTDTTGDYYTVSLTGKITATYDIILSTGTSTFHFVGSFTPSLTRLKGTLQLTKSDLQIHHLSIQLVGITMTKINSLPFNIPFPFKLISDGSLNVDFPLFDFPLSFLEFWNLPDLTLTMSSTFGGIFGLIQIPFTVTVHYGFTPLAFWVVGSEQVTVPAGTYTADKIVSLLGDGFTYYYAPAAGNIVKIDLVLPLGELHAQLKSTTYP